MERQIWQVRAVISLIVMTAGLEPSLAHAGLAAARATARREAALIPAAQLDQNLRAARRRMAARNDAAEMAEDNRRRAIGRAGAGEGEGQIPQAPPPPIVQQPQEPGAATALQRYSIPGDFNNDYIVGLQDIIMMRNNLDQFNGDAKLSDGDFDGDGYVTRADLPYFMNLYGTDERASLQGVHVVKTTEGWQLLVDGQPYVVQGVTYQPDIIGTSPNYNDGRARYDWMYVDGQKDKSSQRGPNGLNDFFYDVWVDLDKDNVQDANEISTSDFQLMADMGINTVRLYHHASDDPILTQANPFPDQALNHAPNIPLLRQIYDTYGIRFAIGDLLGAYAVGSGASYPTGTDYTDPTQRAIMMHSVETMINDFKDEPFVLMWVLGNENNYHQHSYTNADSQPVAYAQFLNEVAARIHELDPTRPVCLANGDTGLLSYYAQYAPNIDIFGTNAYRGESNQGFGTLWEEVATTYDKPVLMTEFGDLRPTVVGGVLDEAAQTETYISSWNDIARHFAGSTYDYRVSLGGFMHTWLDDWWEGGSISAHNFGPADLGLEYQGIASQGNGADSPYMRQLRDVYFAFQSIWT